jgi:hypothetical protein
MKQTMLITFLIIALVVVGYSVYTSQRHEPVDQPQQSEIPPDKPDKKDDNKPGDDKRDTVKGQALYIGLIDNNSAEFKPIDGEHDFDFTAFYISEDVKKILAEDSIPSNTVVLIEYEMPKGEGNPTIINIKEIDEAKIKVIFNGLIDNNFAEFEADGKMYVFQIKQELKESFEQMEPKQQLTLTLKPGNSPMANMLIVDVEK